MAAIFQEVTITWHGVEHRITPTMRLLNRIEQDISLAILAGRIGSGDVPISHIATAVAVLLQSDGVKVSSEEVYQAMLGDDPNLVAQMAQAIVMAAFPTPKKSVNTEQPDQAKQPT